ncbi:hypothetical protein [Paenibacillus silvae]|uniref:hypothetical protein n=1 Tax=Paenibacillus silvae TaxID=1325358 RepID=UPI0020047A03|nr:hypothetical protein [Paenibacillus silvae]MCK6074704.1 hypothetical protein [Paenibacillus silvae]MCK6147821.1 hypothetical protein [Paenibacillus silvae]MCK6266119.1 hypothetical protein [Paenibacillus silvae]
MLRKDKNGFIEIIIRNNLEPSDFTVSEEDRDACPTFNIKHNKSPLEFWVRNSKDSYFDYDCNYIPFSPSFEPVGYEPGEGWFNNIDDVYYIFEDWLVQHIKSFTEEQESQDMWKTFTINGSGGFDWESINEESTESFNKVEKEQLLEQISQFRDAIIENYAPNERLLLQIDSKLNYLSESIDRLNKYDWKSLLISTLMGIITTMSLDKSSGHAVITIAKEIFTNGLMLLK